MSVCYSYVQHPIQWVPGDFPPAVKRPGLDVDHSPPSGAEDKNQWSCTFAPTIYIHGVHRHTFPLRAYHVKVGVEQWQRRG
jgi:hypothetical protein